MSSSAPHSQEGGSCWSDLPELLLLAIVLRLPDFSDLFSFAAVCRSWRLFIRPYGARLLSRLLSSRPPLLLLPNRRSSTGPPLRFLSVDRPDAVDGLRLLLNPKYQRPQDTIGLGYSQGLLLFQITSPDDDPGMIRLVFCDPFTGREISPPPPPPDHFPSIYHAAVLSAPPNDPNSFLILLTLTSVVYCRLGYNPSSYHVHHPLKTPFKWPFYVSSTLPINNRQRVYAVNDSANVLMELSPSDQGEHELDIKIHELASGGWTMYMRGHALDNWHFGPQLAELNGELLMVVFTESFASKTFKPQLGWMQIFRMDFEEMRWVKADNVLDEHAVFVDTYGRCPMFVWKPEQWGGRRNCVYMVDPERKGWREFTLDNSLLVPDYPLPPFICPNEAFPRWPAPVWVYPSCLLF